MCKRNNIFTGVLDDSPDPPILFDASFVVGVIETKLKFTLLREGKRFLRQKLLV